MPRVIKIIEGTCVDGPGLRTSIYFSGCEHRCQGCHNPESWDFMAGEKMTNQEILDIIEKNDFNVTFSGGDPFFQASELIPLAREIKKIGKNIWCYTGFLFENLVAVPKHEELLRYIDVLVDGPYIEALRNPALRFKGSSNQRIINCKHSNEEKIVLWNDSTDR